MALNRKKIKWIVVILSSVIFLVITVCVIIVSQRDLPNDDLRKAREALSEAKEAEADVYSDTKYKQATQIYELGMKNWSRENDRFILVRDYTGVISSARKAKKIAEESKD